MSSSPSYIGISQESLNSDRFQIPRKRVGRVSESTIEEPFLLSSRSSHDAWQSFSSFQKLGWFCTISLFGSTIGIAASVGCISFMWFGHDNNPAWQTLASRDWMTKAIAISSLILRTSITIQAAIATSMIASLVLERTEVLLSQLPSVSNIRNSNAGPYTLAWFLWSPVGIRKRGAKGLILPVLVVMLVLTTFLSQLTSTVLLSDTTLGLVSGLQLDQVLSANIAGGYTSNTAPQTLPWFRIPSTYASFAELPSNGIISGSGFSDTGPSLRAFLPIADQTSRIALKYYAGPATVVDTRVVCFAPNFTVNAVYPSDENGINSTTITGYLSIPRDTVEAYQTMFGNDSRLLDYSAQYQDPIQSDIVHAATGCQIYDDSVMTFCQLSPKYTGSYLLSAFSNNSNGSNWTPGHDLYKQYIVGKVVTPLPDAKTGYNAINTSTNSTDEWTHIYISNSATPLSSTPDLKISLCYTALTSVDMPVQASTNTTRFEAAPVNSNGVYQFNSVRGQMGQSGGSPNSRGLLELSLPNGLSPSGYSNFSAFIDTYAEQTDMGGEGLSLALFTSGSSSLSARSNPELAMFLDEMISNAGKISFGMQSLISVLAGAAYYEQLPNFNNQTTVQQTQLVQAQIPAGQGAQYASVPAGPTRGYLMVVVLTAVHLSLMLCIICWFLLGTSISTLGNAWQAIAQVQGPVMADYISQASLASDKTVQKWLDEDGNGKQLVGIGLNGNRTATRITGIENTTEKTDQSLFPTRRPTTRLPRGDGLWL